VLRNNIVVFLKPHKHLAQDWEKIKRCKMQIKDFERTNELILLEFYNRMKGIIYNRYNKSKGFQFAMLNKNLDELMDLMCKNHELLEEFLNNSK